MPSTCSTSTEDEGAYAFAFELTVTNPLMDAGKGATSEGTPVDTGVSAGAVGVTVCVSADGSGIFSGIAADGSGRSFSGVMSSAVSEIAGLSPVVDKTCYKAES